MRNDIVLDTNVLSDFLSIYYENQVSTIGYFQAKYSISRQLADKINTIITLYRDYDSLEKGLVISSTLGFIEIGRQFDLIANDRFSLDQFRAFINQPPPWFFIAAIDLNLFENLLGIPSHVLLNKESKPIEWADAIHVATMLSRDESCLLSSTDERLKNIEIIKDRIIL